MINKNKKIVLIAAIGLLLAGIVAVTLISKKTSVPLETISTDEISIIAYNPPNNSVDVSVHEIITVILSEDVGDRVIDIGDQPNILLSVSTEGNRIYIQPATQWLYGNQYNFIFLGKEYQFTTQGEMVSSDMPKNNLAQNLANMTPYATDTFSVVSDFTDKGFVFLVELPFGVPVDTGKNDFMQWTEEQGISHEILTTFSVEYFESTR